MEAQDRGVPLRADPRSQGGNQLVEALRHLDLHIPELVIVGSGQKSIDGKTMIPKCGWEIKKVMCVRFLFVQPGVLSTCSVTERVLRVRVGVLLQRSLHLYSRRQEGCMLRRGQVAVTPPACGFPRKWKSFRGVRARLFAFLLFPSLPCHLDRAEKLGIGWVGRLWRKQQSLGCGSSELLWLVAASFLHWLQRVIGL